MQSTAARAANPAPLCDFCGIRPCRERLLCRTCHASRGVRALYPDRESPQWAAHLARLATLAAQGLPLLNGEPSPALRHRSLGVNRGRPIGEGTRSARVRELLAKHPDMRDVDIARKVGVVKSLVGMIRKKMGMGA